MAAALTNVVDEVLASWGEEIRPRVNVMTPAPVEEWDDHDWGDSDEGPETIGDPPVETELAKAVVAIQQLRLEMLEREGDRTQRLANAYACEVALMHHYGFSYRVIAQQIGCSHQQVKRLVDTGNELLASASYVAPNGLLYRDRDEYQDAMMHEDEMSSRLHEHESVIRQWLYRYLVPEVFATSPAADSSGSGDSDQTLQGGQK